MVEFLVIGTLTAALVAELYIIGKREADKAKKEEDKCNCDCRCNEDEIEIVDSLENKCDCNKEEE